MSYPAEVADFVDWNEPVNWAHPLNRGLVSWWLAVPGFAGYGSTVWRDLCNRNHGTLTSMDPKTDWGGARGRSGGWGSLDFDGGGNYVRPASTASSSGEITVSAFAKFASSSSQNTLLSWGAQAGTVGFRWFYVNIFATSTITWQYGTTTSYEVVSSGSVPTASVLDAWAHCVVTQIDSPNKIGFYVNGKLVSETTNAHSVVPVSSKRMTIGNYDNGGALPLTGLLDDVRIHNRALSATEVHELYQQSLHYHPDLLSRIPMRKWFVPQSFNPAWARGSNVVLSYW